MPIGPSLCAIQPVEDLDRTILAERCTSCATDAHSEATVLRICDRLTTEFGLRVFGLGKFGTLCGTCTRGKWLRSNLNNPTVGLFVGKPECVSG